MAPAAVQVGCLRPFSPLSYLQLHLKPEVIENQTQRHLAQHSTSEASLEMKCKRTKARIRTYASFLGSILQNLQYPLR